MKLSYNSSWLNSLPKYMSIEWVGCIFVILNLVIPDFINIMYNLELTTNFYEKEISLFYSFLLFEIYDLKKYHQIDKESTFSNFLFGKLLFKLSNILYFVSLMGVYGGRFNGMNI
jgi:hypothetical protein